MTTPSTVTTFLGGLAKSLLSATPTLNQSQTRRLNDTFRRQSKSQSYSRTNQFDVEERLNGLQERLQVVSRDDLSDSLHNLRLELKECDYQWLPDITDLLLRISNDPISKTRLTDLHEIEVGATTPPLTWKDIVGHDPVDSSDPVWKIPSFSDSSSDEDTPDDTTRNTSPRSTHVDTAREIQSSKVEIPSLVPSESSNVEESLTKLPHLEGNQITEIFLIRECLLLLQGYPTKLFPTYRPQVELKISFTLRDVPIDVMQRILQEIWFIRGHIESVKSWVYRTTDVVYVQVIKEGLTRILDSYFSWTNDHIKNLLTNSQSRTTSISQTVVLAQEKAEALILVATLVKSCRDEVPVSCLDGMFNMISEQSIVQPGAALQDITCIFIDALKAFLRPVEIWALTGEIQPDLQTLVQARGEMLPAAELWTAWFDLAVDGTCEPPIFMLSSVTSIFHCGKTSIFLRKVAKQTNVISTKLESEAREISILWQQMTSIATDTTQPFSAALPELINDCFSSMLLRKTSQLKLVLNTHCSMSQTLNALDYVYLRKNGVASDNFELKIFSQIDQCIDTWNDRFLVADMLEDVFAITGDVEASSILVQSMHTSSRSMTSRRRSVRILAALAIGYRLPWPIANVIPQASMVIYRRIALQLRQLRRVKHILERVAFASLQQQAISENAHDQEFAHTVNFLLLHFTNTIYDHLTTSIIGPSTTQMRDDLSNASTVDAMISVHKSYIHKLDFACLAAPRLKVLRDTLIALLDTCIRFADLVSSVGDFHRAHPYDIEVNSFTSAQSHRRRRRERQRQRRRKVQQQNPDQQDLPPSESSSSSSDDEYDDAEQDLTNIEGYSSFVVHDETSSVVDEVRKLRGEFTSQVGRFVAGLRSVAGEGGSGTVVDDFEVLAGRLDWDRNRD